MWNLCNFCILTNILKNLATAFFSALDYCLKISQKWSPQITAIMKEISFLNVNNKFIKDPSNSCQCENHKQQSIFLSRWPDIKRVLLIWISSSTCAKFHFLDCTVRTWSAAPLPVMYRRRKKDSMIIGSPLLTKRYRTRQETSPTPHRANIMIDINGSIIRLYCDWPACSKEPKHRLLAVQCVFMVWLFGRHYRKVCRAEPRSSFHLPYLLAFWWKLVNWNLWVVVATGSFHVGGIMYLDCGSMIWYTVYLLEFCNEDVLGD